MRLRWLEGLSTHECGAELVVFKLGFIVKWLPGLLVVLAVLAAWLIKPGFRYEAATAWGVVVSVYAIGVMVLVIRYHDEPKLFWLVLGLPLLAGWIVFLGCTITSAYETTRHNDGSEVAQSWHTAWNWIWEYLLIAYVICGLLLLVLPFRRKLGRPSALLCLTSMLGVAANLFGVLLTNMNMPRP